jgi:apolipoprotein N-acyltransferase
MDRAARIPPLLLSLLSGILLLLTFPKWDVGSLAWIALLPLLVCIREMRPWEGFLQGLLTGMIFYLGSVWWVMHAMVHYGGLSFPLSFLVLIALASYLSVFLGVFSFLSCQFQLLKDWRGVLLLPCLWVSLEFLRTYLLSGFPWILLGYSQYKNLYFLQLASLTGIYGLSFLIVLINATIAFCLLKRFRFVSAWKPLLCAGVALAITVGYGHARLQEREEGETVKVAVVQGNIEQSLKWDPAKQKEAFEVHERLTREVARSSPDLIVWPETALPAYLRTEPNLRQELQSLTDETGAFLLVGSPDLEQKGRGDVLYFNSAFLFSPGKNSLEKYDKIHLVPFGEYVPLRRLLPFINKLTEGIGDFSAGKEVKIFSLPRAKFGVSICFEVIFPDLVRRFRTQGANFLVNMTNDAWFGSTGAPYQHLSMAVARAVENGCYLVRAANTGISAIISAQGRIIRSSSLFREDQFAAIIQGANGSTFYTRHGDLLAPCCLLAVLALVLSRVLPGWKGARKVKRGEPRRR